MMTVCRCEESLQVNSLIKSGFFMMVCVHFVKNRFLFCGYDTINVSPWKCEKWDCGHFLYEMNDWCEPMGGSYAALCVFMNCNHQSDSF